MSLSSQNTGCAPRWSSAETRAAVEAEALIAEHQAANDPDRIEAVARGVLFLFSPELLPRTEDLLVIDNLRASAAAIRTRRYC